MFVKKISLLLIVFFVFSVGLNFVGCGSSPTTNPAVPTPTPGPVVLCGSPSSWGVTTASQPATLTIPANSLETQAITLVSGATATAISLYVAGPVTQQVRFAIYNDNGSNYPNNLVIDTVPQYITSGWNSASIPNVYLPAGTYHLVFLYSYSGLSAFNGIPHATTGQTNYYQQPAAWGTFPDTFPAALGSDAWSIPFYVSTCP
jgi:hypothetical protein